MRAAPFRGGPLLFAPCAARAQGPLPALGRIFTNTACGKRLNWHVKAGIMNAYHGARCPVLAAWCGARLKRGRGMEDWMKQPADIRRPKQGQGERRGMAEVPLGSVEIPVSDVYKRQVFQHSIFIGFKRRRFKRLRNVNSQRAQIHSNIRKCGSDL